MKCQCKFCGKEIKLSDLEETLIDCSNSGNYDDVELDDNISPYRLDVSINPSRYTDYGEFEEEEFLIAEKYDEMCKKCKDDLVNSLKLTVYSWKKSKGVL